MGSGFNLKHFIVGNTGSTLFGWFKDEINNVDDNKAKFSKVEILGDENELIWISGLPEKVTIITVGHEFVSNGDSVNYRLQDENS